MFTMGDVCGGSAPVGTIAMNRSERILVWLLRDGDGTRKASAG
jgi:hypothetical protein